MLKRIKVSPSILAADLTNIETEIKKLADAGADLIHLDVMDGHYVPNLTFGMPVIRSIAQLTDIPLDTHLMVMNPADYLDDLADIGVEYISYHPETVIHNHRFIYAIREKGIRAGWAINPGVSESILDPVISDLDFVLLMSVNPGFSGQKFIPSVYEKIRHVRSMTSSNNGFEIEVDGGVNNENAPELARCGADILVAGAYILGADDYSQRIRSLRDVE